MTNFEEKFKQEGQQIRLSDSEKQAIKNRVLAMPINDRVQNHNARWWGLFASAKAVVASVFVIIFLVSIPLTYAIQRSDPGDLLHGIELAIIEPIQYNLQFTEESKLDYISDRLEERLSELNSSDGSKISTDEINQMHENIEGYVALALDETAQSNDQESIDQLINVSALLHAHEDVSIENGYDDDSIIDLNTGVEKELSEQLTEYLHQHPAAQNSEIVNQEVDDIEALINDHSSPADQAAEQALTEIEQALAQGNYQEALKDAVEVKIEVLAQNYVEDSESE